MRIIDTSENHYWRNVLTRITFVIITVAVIVWFLPHNEEQRFHYDVGKPWMYGSFIARFDFPIYKSDETIKAEQDSLMEVFQPYYNYNANVERQAIAKFKEDFKKGIPGLQAGYLPIIIDRLHRLYQAGIMSTLEYNDISKDSTSMIRVVSGKNAQILQINCIYSTFSAYEQLLSDEKLAKEKLILQKCNLTNYIEPNLAYDKTRSETERDDLLSSIPLASGMVMSGQKIIDRGEIVDDYDYRVLSSFEREMKRRSLTSEEFTSTVIGQILYVGILVLLFTIYLALFRHDYFYNLHNLLMMYVLIMLFPILVSLMMEHNLFSVYIIPFALVPIFTSIFMDSRTAFITHATTILICAAAVKYQYEFIIVQLASGLVAIYTLQELSQRAQLFKTAIFVALTSCAVYFALQLMQDSAIAQLDQSMYYHFAVNGVFLLLAYPLMYVIEKVFGFTSDITLFELSNTNKGLLRKLSETTPGTFQHSITVGNLAAEIANRIGANSLLVRTGALYHDIGKMCDPVFFTENQAGANPHNHLDYKKSAQVIIGHVTEGVKLAEKADLPAFIKDFILTHHGHGVAKYFYIKYKNEHPEEEIDPEPFTYPGPNPFTREQAILMMADAVEAASRSLPEYTEESISNVVNKIIDQQVSEGYFKECPITFRDIALAKIVLTERLKSIYHTRIQYPELKKTETKA